METILQQTISPSFVSKSAKTSVISKFMNWCENQDTNRFGWLAAALGAHGCLFTPLTLFAIVLSGNSITLWMVAIVAMIAVLVSNLSAMPTKISIPVFLLSIIIDLAIVITCIAIGFNIANAY